MSAVIRWENPPPSKAAGPRNWTTRESKLGPVAEELRARPGQWGVVYEGDSPGQASGTATRIRLGQARCFTPTGDFDAVTRRVAGKHVVYARYVRDES